MTDIENGQQVDPAITNVTEDTPPVVQTPPVQDGNGNGEDVVKPQAITEPAGDELAQKREDAKLQQVQSELSDLKEKDKKSEDDLARLRAIEQRAVETPERYKQALVEFNGLSEQEASMQVNQMKAQGAWTNQPTGQVQGQAPAQPAVDPVQQQVYLTKTIVEQERQKETVRQEVFKEIPAMNPANISEEDKPYIKSLATALDQVVEQKVAQGSKEAPAKLFVEAYKKMTRQTDEQIQTAREDGVRQGYLNAQSDNAGAVASTKGVSMKEKSFGLNSEQLASAKAEGLTPEEFSQFSNKEVTVD